MRKKLIYLLSLSVTFILLFFLILLNCSYSSFDSSNVKDTIDVLSSETFNGRLAGSTENTMVADFIENKFKESNLKTYGDGSYKKDFNTICPISTDTTPYLKIMSNGKVEEELQYGVDFKEDMINFRGNTFTFSNKDKISSFYLSIEVTTSENKFLFFVPNGNELYFRSSFMSDFPYDAVIMVTENTKNKILNSLNEGKEISVHVPFEAESKTISNVVGVIEGTDKEAAPLVITAHFDHLGKDGLGNICGGALDNASGTSFMLELQRSLSTFAKPNRDIIFVALNAEEFGLLGSKQFAEDNIFNLKNSEVINFDMVGSAGFPITFMQGVDFKDKDSELLKSLEELCKKNNTSYEVVYQDSSDHASFNKLGIDSVSFCHSDLSKIHTPYDTTTYISTDAIDSVYEIVNQKIMNSCYNNFTLLLYNKLLILVLSIILGVLVGYPLLKKKVK